MVQLVEEEAALIQAATELEHVLSRPQQQQESAPGFPRSCRRLLLSIPGNHQCCDCGAPHPNWASVTYGTLLCLRCSGRHRSYGVQTSFVRSVSMDAWSHEQILSLLEGGNAQMNAFFERHGMHYSTTATRTMNVERYYTKAALFYKINLKKHVQRVARWGPYQGREFNRRMPLIRTPATTTTTTTTTCHGVSKKSVATKARNHKTQQHQQQHQQAVSL